MQPRAFLGRPSPHPAGGWAGGQGGWGPRSGSEHSLRWLHWQRDRERAGGHSPSGGRLPGPPRTVREAAPGSAAGASLKGALGRGRGCPPLPPTAGP